MPNDPCHSSDAGPATEAKADAVEHVFATPIVSRTFHDATRLNDRLRSLILEREATMPSATRSNQGGWQSPPEFFRWQDAAVETVESMIGPVLDLANGQIGIARDFALEFELFGWAAVNRRGDYNSVHLHPEATWSGVYYVDAGNEPDDAPAALLEFIHPIPAALMSFFPGILPSARTVRPQTGMMIVFPGYLQHCVRVYHGERPRICVAFNAHLRGARREGEWLPEGSHSR